MSKRTRKGQIPGLPGDTPAGLRSFLEAVKQAVEIGEGQRGDPRDEKVTKRDLLDLGIAEEGRAREGSGGISIGSGAQLVSTSPEPNRTVPPAPKGFQANGAHTNAILEWAPPGYNNHGITEIHRSPSRSLGSASLVGTQASRIHADPVGSGSTVWYWIRFVSDAGVPGPFSSPIKVETTPDFDAIRDSITATQWEPEFAYGLFEAVSPTSAVTLGGAEIRLIVTRAGITGANEPAWESELSELGETITDGSVIWQAVEAGKIPFLIDPETGLVVIEGAAMREASIEALSVKDGFFDRITAAKGTLKQANISIANIFEAIVENEIKSDNFSAGSNGWRIRRNGAFEFNGGLFRGDIESNGLFKNQSGNRYIDFRPGEATEGDFILGDVGSRNFISFKNETGVGRVLRVRGQIYGQDYAPGNTSVVASATRTGTMSAGNSLSGSTDAPQDMFLVRLIRFGVVRLRLNLTFQLLSERTLVYDVRAKINGSVVGSSTITVVCNNQKSGNGFGSTYYEGSSTINFNASIDEGDSDIIVEIQFNSSQSSGTGTFVGAESSLSVRTGTRFSESASAL